MKQRFKLHINWNKDLSKAKIQRENLHLDCLIDPFFQGVNRQFVSSFQNGAFRKIHTRHFFLTIEIKDYNVMIDGRNFFDKPMKNDLRTYDNI